MNLWDGIAGIRGSVNLGRGGFFIPYYLDVGAGSSNLTWQVASGIGYRTGPFSFSAQYRYLAFEQGKNAVVGRLSLGGPIVDLAVSF
jgi:hypothetical protein